MALCGRRRWPASPGLGPLVLYGLFRKDYRSLSKERNRSLQLFCWSHEWTLVYITGSFPDIFIRHQNHQCTKGSNYCHRSHSVLLPKAATRKVKERGSFQLHRQNCIRKHSKEYLTKSSVALHIFDRTIKPILTYGCEIWAPMSKTVRTTENILESLYQNLHGEKLHT